MDKCRRMCLYLNILQVNVLKIISIMFDFLNFFQLKFLEDKHNPEIGVRTFVLSSILFPETEKCH